jgi:hypothetical protein
MASLLGLLPFGVGIIGGRRCAQVASIFPVAFMLHNAKTRSQTVQKGTRLLRQ